MLSHIALKNCNAGACVRRTRGLGIDDGVHTPGQMKRQNPGWLNLKVDFQF